MKKSNLVLWLGLALACCSSGFAADVATVAKNGVSTGYASFAEAIAACTGGESVTLLADASVTGSLPVTVPVSVDLGGFTLSNTSGQFIKPTAGADGLSFKNGTITASDCCFAFQTGSFTVSVSNVTFNGVCVLYGSGGTLEFQAGCLAKTRTCFLSSWGTGGCGCNVRGGVVACSAIYDSMSNQGTKLMVYGGSWVVDPSSWLGAGVVVEASAHTAQGVSCSYAVRSTTADDGAVAIWTSADGSTVEPLQTVVGAFEVLANDGGTLKLMTNCTLTSRVSISTNATLDLNGFTLATAEGNDGHFMLKSGLESFTVENGTLTASNCVWGSNTGAGSVLMTNCTVSAKALVSGYSGTFDLADCQMNLQYLVSSASTVAIRIPSGVYAISCALSEGWATRKSTLAVSGGRFSLDVADCLAAGCSQIVDDAVTDGLATHVRVLPTAEAGTLYEAQVVAAEGTATDYATVSEAVAACPAGGTVRILQDSVVSGSLSIPHSMTLDLNGLALKNTKGNFIAVPDNVTLDVKNGLLYGAVSLFNVNAGVHATVNATNCILTGLCPVWGRGTLNLYDCFMKNMYLFGSANGSATMHVYGGHYAFEGWRDSGTEGTSFFVHDGYFQKNPLVAGVAVVASGSRVFYESHTYREQGFGNHVMSDALTADWTVEASIGGVLFTNVVTALYAGGDRATICLESDIARPISTYSTAKTTTLDLRGHEMFSSSDEVNVSQKAALYATNGVVRTTAAAKSSFTVGNSSQLHLQSGVTLSGPQTGKSCGVYISSSDAKIVLDGANVRTTVLSSWSTAGVRSSLTVLGEGTNTCSEFTWSSSALPANASLVIRGGWWAANPTAYVTNNHVVLHREGLAPCPWRVRDWTKLASGGWTFAFDDPMLGATGTGTLEAGTVEVSLTGTVPLRRTLLVDLSQATVAGGTLAFTKSPDLAGDVKVVYENGCLYAWQAKGTLIVFR